MKQLSLSLRKAAPVFLALCLMAGSVACTGGGGQSTQAALEAQSASAPQESRAEAAAEAANVADPMAKYDPPITVSTIFIVDDTIKYKDGDSYDSNAWTRAYEEELGIQLEYQWTVPQLQASDKINILIATNDLPDMMRVDMKQLQRLVESKVETVVELGSVFESYATEFTKEVRPASDIAFKSATFGGNLMALPYNATTGLDKTAVLWIRQDWLDNLGLEAPKTMDELMAVAEAFVTRDPDGNGVDDTYGIAVTQNLVDTFGGLDGLFFAYHSYPGSWVKDESGRIVYGSILPETRTALEKLQEFYEKGFFDPEFGTKDGGKVAEYTSAGRIGIEMGMMWNPAWPLNGSKDNDPDADWRAFPLVTTDDQPTLSVVDVPVSNYVVVSKDCEHPEAAVKMLNLFYDKVYGPEADTLTYWEDEDGLQAFKYASIMSERLYQNLDIHNNCMEALASGDTSRLSAMEQVNFEKINNVLDGSTKSADWSMYATYGPDSSFAVLKQYEEQGLYFYNEFYGAPTETMASKGSNLVKSAGLLSKMENEIFTKIIMGAPIESFDEFVEDWKRLGGEQITEEVNDWYAGMQ